MGTGREKGEGIIEGIKETPAMRNPTLINRCDKIR